MGTITLKDGTRLTVDESWKVLRPEEKQRRIHMFEDTGDVEALRDPVANTIAGTAKSLGSSLVRGAAAIPGFPGDMLSLTDAGVRLAPKLIGRPEAKTGRIAVLPTSQDFVDWFERDITKLYEGRTNWEKTSGKVAEYVPQVLSGPGGPVRKVLQNVVGPALGDELGERVAEHEGLKGTAWEPVLRGGGSILGSGPGVSTVQRVITPLPTNPRRIAHADELRNAGVYVRAGQETGRPTLQAAESEWGEGGSVGLNWQQGEDYTEAVLRDVGENSRFISPDVVNNAHRRIGGELDRLAATYPLIADRQLLTDMQRVLTRYSGNAGVTGASQRAPIVEGTINDIVALANGQPRLGMPGPTAIAGEIYQRRRSDIARETRNAGDDNSLREALHGLRDALDDAMERSMRATVPRGATRQHPQARQVAADIAQQREMRRQYGNLMVVEDAMTIGRAEDRGAGIITPVALGQAAMRGPRKKAFIRGRSDYTDLALAGQHVLTPYPQSGTATRAFVRGVPALVGATLAGYGGSMSDMATSAALSAGGAVLGATAGQVVLRPRVQGWLRNQRGGQPPGNGPMRRMRRTATYNLPRLLEPLVADEGPVRAATPFTEEEDALVALGPQQPPIRLLPLIAN